MRAQVGIHHPGRYLLSLIILIANIAAPFRTPAGRAVLDIRGQHRAPQSVARVRAHSQIGSHGFRALVGLPRAESGEALSAPSAPLFWAVPTCPRVACRGTQPEPSSARLRPPLRC